MHSTMKTRTRCALLVIAFVTLSVSTLPLQGRPLYGANYGQVTDQGGAAVPNATITVNDESKGTSVQVPIFTSAGCSGIDNCWALFDSPEEYSVIQCVLCLAGRSVRVFYLPQVVGNKQ
jgi:hypothetical protein